MKDIYVTLARFLTQLKKLCQNIKIIRISLLSKKVSTVDENNKFSFERITANDISQQIKRLQINEAAIESDIPTKLVKRFDNLIVDYLQENSIIVLQNVPSLKTLNRWWFIQPIKRSAKWKHHTTDQLPFCLIYLKFTNNFYLTKCVLLSVIFSYVNAVFVREIVPYT